MRRVDAANGRGARRRWAPSIASPIAASTRRIDRSRRGGGPHEGCRSAREESPRQDPGRVPALETPDPRGRDRRRGAVVQRVLPREARRRGGHGVRRVAERNLRRVQKRAAAVAAADVDGLRGRRSAPRRRRDRRRETIIEHRVRLRVRDIQVRERQGRSDRARAEKRRRPARGAGRGEGDEDGDGGVGAVLRRDERVDDGGEGAHRRRRRGDHGGGMT
mmetsp:Transcript_10843/g.39281  ORF Transcript_10843/g.39281 Transcript_10843/m.39281 type:complete len:219 (-) Transcript_10843:644-1300(-)